MQNSGPWDPRLPVVKNSRLFAQRAVRPLNKVELSMQCFQKGAETLAHEGRGWVGHHYTFCEWVYALTDEPPHASSSRHGYCICYTHGEPLNLG